MLNQSAPRKTAAAADSRPYIPGGDEKYMSVRQLKYFRKMLNDALARINSSLEKTIDSLRDDIAAIPDENDRASKEAEFSLELRERERENRLIEKITKAINRIENKKFGYCDECLAKIGVERLLARPVASLCFECKNLQERLERTQN